MWRPLTRETAEMTSRKSARATSPEQLHVTRMPQELQPLLVQSNICLQCATESGPRPCHARRIQDHRIKFRALLRQFLQHNFDIPLLKLTSIAHAVHIGIRCDKLQRRL